MIDRLKRLKAFTMVELLIVMAIIILIAAIMFPAIGSAKKAAMRSKARSDIKMLHSAIMSFKNEYNRYPLWGTIDKTEDINEDIFYKAEGVDYTDRPGAISVAQYNLIRSLRGDFVDDNPRGITYMKINEASLDEEGRFCDPWDRPGLVYGYPYYAMVDSDYDGMLNVEIQSHGVEINTVSNHAIAVWSLGDREDNDPEMGPFTSWGGEFVERENEQNN